MYKTHSKCRACNYGASGPRGIKSSDPEKLVEVFDLGLQPLANDFGTTEHAGYAPLKVMFCPRCTLAQLSVVVKPSILYSSYAYVTSKSATMQNHFGSLLGEIRSEIDPQSLVEIGSNDGDFLKFAQDSGIKRTIGIDPAQNLTSIANERGLTTICSVFNCESAYSAALSVNQPDVIVARHVFAHMDDWDEFMRGIDILSSDKTITVIEVPYVVDLLNRVEFDTIYHEHLSYVSIFAIRHLLDRFGFHIHKIVRFKIHGGTLAIMIRRNVGESSTNESTESFKENITADTWSEFANRARHKISSLADYVAVECTRGNRVCGFGASAKSTVWINACGFTKKQIKFICDSTPYKQYTFSPGSDIPIVDEGALLRELPDLCINFAWNFHDFVLYKNQLYLEKGGKIISPYDL